MKLPIVIISDEDYLRAIERIAELKFEPGNKSDDAELVALAEAMLRWEINQDMLDEMD